MTNGDTPPPQPPTLSLVDKLYAVHNITSLVPVKLDSWIFLTLAETLQRRLIKANPTTTKAAWEHVEKIFLDNKRTRTIALKGELRVIQRGELSVDAYFHKIESIVTLLNDLGSPISDDDVVTYAMHGLSDKFAQIAGIIAHQEPFPDLETMRSMVTTEEMRLNTKSQNSISNTTGLRMSSNGIGNVGMGLDGQPQLIALLNAQNQLLPNYGLSHQLGQAQSYLQATPNSLLGSRSTPPGFGLPNTQQGQAASNLSSQQQALLARTLYGSTNAPRSSLPGQETILPQAFNTMTLQDPANANWNMDTGVSSHLNSDDNNLNSQFVRDNNCTVEFDEFGFSVKDFGTRQILLRCDSTGDLYPVTNPTTPQAFLVSQHTWHQRLGHPRSDVLRSLVSNNFISCNKTKSLVLSHACQLGKHVQLPFSLSETIVKSPFDIIHSDLWTSPLSSITALSSLVATRGSTSHNQPATSPSPQPSPNPPDHNQSTTPVQPTHNTNPNPVSTHLMVTRFRVGSNCPTQRFTLNVSTISPLPKSYTHAFRDPNWHSAMIDEYNALIKNNTWILVPRPHDANIVCSTWLFRHKHNADGSLSRYKARLVAYGSAQLTGIDLDVKNAFLHGYLSKTIYMHQPPGFRDHRHPDHVCLLQRSLYGLRQAPRAWFQRFAAYAARVGFHHSRFLTASSFTLLQQYATEVLERANMLACNPCRTPVDTDTKLAADGDPVFDPTLYRSLAGALQYLTFTRPDISYAVQQVCLFMHDPREPHFSALKRILRYVRGTLDYGLQLYSSSTSSLVAYSDADLAGCHTTRRSTSGYCVFFCNNLLSWSSKLQFTLSRSSAEVEYREVANAVAETCWLRNLLRELYTPLPTATIVSCDNTSSPKAYLLLYLMSFAPA
ncbi:ribonuclease H-like domain-containing protein [Tanacetum coccineum]